MYSMADIRKKPITRRCAVATGRLYTTPDILEIIMAGKNPKGPALGAAQLCGLQAMKTAFAILPLCHPLALLHGEIRFHHNKDENCLEVAAAAYTEGKTGIEMEALLGVSAALLCVYDMTKPLTSELEITDQKLIFKSGGKGGVYQAMDILPIWLNDLCERPTNHFFGPTTAAVITLSDRASQGIYADTSGPALADRLRTMGAEIFAQELIPDQADLLLELVKKLITEEISLIITTGGTGVSPRDITPETLAQLGGVEIPGVGQLFRHYGADITPLSYASRCSAWIVSKSLVLCLPGNLNAIHEGIDALQILIPHLVKILRGQA